MVCAASRGLERAGGMEMNEKLNKGEAMEANMEWAGDGLQWMKRRNEADAQGISGQLAATAGAPSLSPLAPDSNPFKGLLVQTEC